ncbi:hypothetical protein ES332_A13G245200v1 [Gossypium tomentosum]|uniref:Uncharacterized protein n=1 Tax=Gossypium tomentosum TaxID=34277 RepID=A0A5D2MQA6_GOSTO|nr:hypothetical protein ES332_A13G245200v1 [Gossypium tomentosum]
MQKQQRNRHKKREIFCILFLYFAFGYKRQRRGDIHKVMRKTKVFKGGAFIFNLFIFISISLIFY